MSKIFNLYTKDDNGNDIDRTWYDSSNIKYSECLDKENSLKTLKVVFKNGTQYEYKNVEVNQYLLFREALSQGKALNEYIKSKDYEYEKLENADLVSLDGELAFRENGGIFVFYKTNEKKLTILDNKDNVLLEKEVVFTQESFDVMCEALRVVGNELYVDVDYPISDNGEREIIDNNLPF